MQAASPGTASSGTIVTIGEILVEIMAETRGDGFREPLALRGPFPSGAPAIFIDQVARLDAAAGMIACVGDDDFGRLNVERLRRDGVDVRAIRIDPEQATGSAFVRYREDGERDFVFNIRHSASGRTRIDAAAGLLLQGCRHLHIMGSSLFSAGLIEAARQAAAQVRTRGGTVSFDPNVRKEMLRIPEMRAALEAMLHACDIFMPSGPELTLLTAAPDEAGAIAEILSLGVAEIVVKRGAGGASHYDRDGARHMAAFRVAELDPTGAGDCFGATFVTCRLQGMSVPDSLRYASASGARAVGVRGPMEGACSFAELDAFIIDHRGVDDIGDTA
ncbi:tagatose kinase [Lichenicoccus sp.]|uniref:tagatose kinase n=1 Tax=Lichenicoccus sp. TaxID=2781899 RepID=UPI003D0D9C78